MNEWYAYIHINWTLHVKRFFGDYGDVTEARSSDFVLHVFDPFEASSRQDAIEKITPEYERLKKKYKRQ